MPVYAVERILTFVVAKTDTVITPWSWRLGRCIRGLALTVSQTIWWLSIRLGWVPVSSEFLQAALDTCPRAVPTYPVMPLEQVSQRATELLRGVCLLDDGTRVSLERLSWRSDPFGDVQSSSRFRFHAFRWVWELLQAYHLTVCSEYLRKAKELTERWIAECLYMEKGEYIWDDHATALRAIALCQLWTACRAVGSQSESFAKDLLAALIRHGEKLANASFYRADHNHGVTQAHALLAIGLMFPHGNAEKWTRLGRARLEAQMRENVSAEGFHREHSPSYQVDVLRQFYDAYKLGSSFELEFSDAFLESLQKMLLRAALFVKPNGILAALGDTCPTSPLTIKERDLIEWPGSTGEYLYRITKGTRGNGSVSASNLFPASGYVFFRGTSDQTEPLNQERFLLCRLSTFDTSHVHRDVFSFELYAYGNDLIVDSGGPYAYGDPVRNFFQSTAAHNTVVVDGQDQMVGEARLLHWETSPEYDLLDAEFQGYPGVTHRRAIIFVRPDYFIILDRLDSSKRHHFSQLFHLNPDLHASLGGAVVTTAHCDGGSTVQILPLLDGVEAKLHQGSLRPLQGWVCLGEGRKIPNTVVEYRQTGTSVVFAALLLPQRRGTFLPVHGHFDGALSQKDTRIHVSIGNWQHEIRLSPDGHMSFTKREVANISS
jgi:hypothetical protein